MSAQYGPDYPAETYVPHTYAEQLADLGEITMNYATTGSADLPALLLVPGQTESWWGYEMAMPLLEKHFQVFAVDLRGQGRSSRTPGRYTLDNFGNDLVRFISSVIRRSVIVSGLSSGGLCSAWLSAYAMPGMIRGAHYEDPPLFHAEVNPSCGQSIRQGIGPMFALYAKYLGDQWSVGDWAGMRVAAPHELPAWIAALRSPADTPPQNLKEYDPEWARAFWTGSVSASCDHARMLSNVKVPILFTHHFRTIEEKSGFLIGALSDLQVARAKELVTSAGQSFEYHSFPEMGHSMHGEDPKLFADLLIDWAQRLP